MLIYIKDKHAQKLQYGDVLLIDSTYNEVLPPLNPAEFNYKKYLANKNIYHHTYLYPGQYAVVQQNQGNALIAYALKLRKALVKKLQAGISNPNAAAVASTLILGYRADLSEEIRQTYSKTGTIHVLSVSGAHVGLVYLVLAWGLAFLRPYRYGRILQTVIIIALIWFYALLTGFSPPVCRAAVMLSLIITGKTYSRQISMLNILAFSAFVMLLYNPLYITDVGFQLSYAAMAGLIVIQPLVYRLVSIKNNIANKIWLVCSASVSAQAATLPLSMYYFHQIPLYFLISNLFILIPSALIMYTGMLYLLLPQGFILTGWLGVLLEKLILFTNSGLYGIEHAPLAVLDKIWLTTPQYILLWALVITMVACLLYRNAKLPVYTAAALITCFVVVTGIHQYNLKRSKEVVFLSMGKYDGIIFRHNNRAAVLTSLKVQSSSFKYSVQPYMDSCNIQQVDIIPFDTDTVTAIVKIKNGVVSFDKTRIYIPTVNNVQYPRADMYYITNNPVLAINSIKQFSHRPLLVIGNNRKKYTYALVERAGQVNIQYKILFRNKALVIASN